MSPDSAEQHERLLMSDRDRRSCPVGMYYTLDVFGAGSRDNRCAQHVEALFSDLPEHKQTRIKIINNLDSPDNNPVVVQLELISQVAQMPTKQYGPDPAYEREHSDSLACALPWLQGMSSKFRKR